MSARNFVRGMVRGAIEGPIFTMFAIVTPLVYLDYYGLDLWSVGGNHMFFAGELLVLSGLVGLKIARKISRKVLGPELEPEPDLGETLAEKRP